MQRLGSDVGQFLRLDADIAARHMAVRLKLRADAADMSEGMAKPMPTDPPVGDRIAVFMPTALPSWANSGPPELPWLIGASIWMNEYGLSPMSRLTAETIPAVTVPPRPNGLPTATTHCPASHPLSCQARYRAADDRH